MPKIHYLFWRIDHCGSHSTFFIIRASLSSFWYLL